MKKFLIGLAIIALAGAGMLIPGNREAKASAGSQVVYDALPSVSPLTNYPSQPFQAQQTAEFGDYIHLGGTARVLNTVTVTMSDWALYSDYSSDIRYSGDSANWTHPITLNVYNVVPGTPNQLGSLLGTVTRTISIPWRPASDNCGGDSTAWTGANGCAHGLAFNAVFDLSSLGVTLPDDVIVGVAFNTETWGYSPIGTSGPYNSLNVAVPPSQVVSVGTDYSNSEVFWNTETAGYYADGGAGGVGTFREDTNWSPYGTVALQITANLAAPTNKDQCKKDGWKDFTDPTFKNQGDCVSYVATHKTFTASDSSYYNGPTSSSPLYGNGPISFSWDAKTGTVTGGYYNEIVPPTTGTIYYNVITSGSVVGDTVNLTFNRTTPSAYGPFTFTGTLSGKVLTGTLDGPYLFTATGN